MSAADRLDVAPRQVRAQGDDWSRFIKPKPQRREERAEEGPKFASVYEEMPEPAPTRAGRMVVGGYLRPTVRLNALKPVQVAQLTPVSSGGLVSGRVTWHMRSHPVMVVRAESIPHPVLAGYAPEVSITIGDPWAPELYDANPDGEPLVVERAFDYVNPNELRDSECNPLLIPRTSFLATGRLIVTGGRPGFGFTQVGAGSGSSAVISKGSQNPGVSSNRVTRQVGPPLVEVSRQFPNGSIPPHTVGRSTVGHVNIALLAEETAVLPGRVAIFDVWLRCHRSNGVTTAREGGSHRII